MRPIGLQLYTLRKPFAADPLGTLQQIRAAGYDSVEFAAPLDMDFASLAARMRDIALDCPSVHVGLADITGQPGRVLEVAKTLGCRFIVLPYVDPNDADWKAVVAQAQTFARQAQGEGFRFCYHHHHFEFDDSRGFRPFDILVGESDPSLLFFELDVYWLKTAGQDPLAMIERMAGRVKLLHLKDALPDGNMTDVGSGTLDFPALIAAGDAAGVEYMFVEHDFPPKPYWPSVEASLAYLRTMD
jgi:sugar phosphate isomerase/epimerase